VYGPAEEEAADILAALPDGWSLMKRPDERMWFRLEDAERRGARQERERLRALAWSPYPDRGGDGIQYGQCLVCGDDGLSEADVAAFFADPSS